MQWLEIIQELTALAVKAAIEIRRTSQTDGVRSKPDGSPVTSADLKAERLIRVGLASIAPSYPVVSEEQISKPEALHAEHYFLVDPLDGTREFLDGRDEYAVNIALMNNGQPMVGVMVAPAQGLIWRGVVGAHAERLQFTPDGTLSRAQRIMTRPTPETQPIVLVSRSHLEAKTKEYLTTFAEPKIVPCGSSIKFSRIAEGAADVYARLGPTHDWDIAAGHAILRAAGGDVLRPDGEPVVYGTDRLIVPCFIAWGTRERLPSPR